MTFRLEIRTDNDAFVEDRGRELGRILGVVAEHVRLGLSDGRVRDINGNTVGEWSVEDDDD